jgi:hypothetical protein
MMPTVIINEQHTLLPDQKRLLDEFCGSDGYAILEIPFAGWTWEQQQDAMRVLSGDVIFVSPIPAMIARLSYKSGQWSVTGNEATRKAGEGIVPNVFVMANDQREKKELPDGIVISVTAKTGWYLV